jgi:alpha-L-fucosidase
MFIHWGVYAVPAGEWQGQPVGGIGEWIMKNGKIPVADYRGFAKDFAVAKYDPSAWAKLAKEAGMKYVVITAKHHDGFALYDSAVTGWDAADTAGAKRDLLKPLAEAVRAEGLKFGLYYSQAQDWTHPGGAKAGGKGWDPAQDGDYDKYLAGIALPQVKEIVGRYQPAILWWDTPVDMTPERVKPFADFMAEHPGIINNNRLGKEFAGDTKTPEQNIPPRGYPGERFEVCRTMNDTWGFKKNDGNWKSVRQLVRNLSDIASKGGNFLLNVGPTAEGVIPPESVERLQAIGRWMSTNGEAIYATQAGPFPRRLPWGRATQKRDDSGATTLYLHVWEWPEDGKILLPTVKEIPSGGKLLAGGKPVAWKHSAEGLVVELPGAATDPDVSVVRLDFPGAVTVTQEPFISPDAAGRVSFGPLDADAHGHWDGNIQVRGTGKDAYLTDWKNPKWRLEYWLKTTRAQKWNVSAEVATPEPAKLTLDVKKTSTPAEIAATGPGLTWKTVPLGTIELPAGETGFEIKGGNGNWKGISIRRVWLEPAGD